MKKQINKLDIKPNNFLVYAMIACAGLGGILYGYDIGVISGALLFVQKVIPMTDAQLGVIVGAVLGGGIVGTLVTGPLADRFGRRTMIISACVLFFIGIISILLAKTFVLLLISRLFLGVAVGIVAVAVPLYLTEVAPAEIRGRSITIFQLLLTIGIVLAYFVDLLFTPSGNWRGMFAVILIPTSILLIGMLLLPETPRFLMSKNNKALAQKILLQTRNSVEAKKEIIQIQTSLKKTEGSWRALFKRTLWLPLAVSLIIATCNQLTGVNVVLQYAPMLIEKTGLHSDMISMFGTVGIGLVNLLGTIVAFFLIDRFGRRILLLVGTAGVIIAYVFLGLLPHFSVSEIVLAELSLVGFVVFIAFYAIGPGVVVWLAISELLPTKVRGKAVALALLVNSIAGCLLSSVFLTLQNALSLSGTYLLLAGFTLIYFLVALFLLPETKGKTLEEIQKNFV